jgi:hypothetical protein
MSSPYLDVRLAALAILAGGAMTTAPSLAHSHSGSRHEAAIAGGGSATDSPGVELRGSEPTPDLIFSDDFDPPVNDTCQTATALLLGTPVNGTTINASSNYDSGLETCTGFAQPGGDVAYAIPLAAGTSITVTLSAPAATFDPSISLLGPGSAAAVCDAVPVTCLAGADAGVDGDGESFAFTASVTGNYYIIVDSYASFARGAFTLNVTSP